MTDSVQRVYQLVIDARGAQAGADAFVEAFGGVDGAGQKVTRTLAQLQRASDAQDRRFNQSAANMQKMSNELQLVTQRLEQGNINLEEAATLVGNITVKYDEAARAASSFEKAFASGNAAALASLGQQDNGVAAAAAAFQAKANQFAGIQQGPAFASTAAQSASVFSSQIAAEERLAAAMNQANAGYTQYESHLSSLRERFVPLAAAQNQYRAQLALLNEALQIGALQEVEYADALARTKSAFAAQVVAINGNRNLVNGLTGTFQRLGPAIQNAGYQVGDFAVQVASGQGVLRPFIQQGTQLISMFGPWGAVIGAAGAVVGALATSFLDSKKAAEDAAKAVDTYAGSLRAADELAKMLKNDNQASIDSLQAERRYRLGVADAAIQEAQAKIQVAKAEAQRLLAGADETPIGSEGAAVNIMQSVDKYKAQVNVLTQAEKDIINKQREIAAELRFGADNFDPFAKQGQDFTADYFKPDAVKDPFAKKTKGITDQNKELEQNIKLINDAVAAGDKQTSALEAQVTAQQRLAAAAKDGPISEREAQITNDIAEKTRSLNDALQLAFATKNTKAVAELQAQIAATAQGTRDLAAAAQEYAQNKWFRGAFDDQGYKQFLLQTQIDNVFGNDNQQKMALANAQAIVELEKQSIPLTDERAQSYLRSVAATEQMNATLERQKAIASELPNAFDQAFDRIGEAVTQFAVQGGDAFKSLENIGNAVLSELLQEGIKLSLINPAKNWLNGDNQLPTLNSLIDHHTGSNYSGDSSSSGDLGAIIGSLAGSGLSNLFADGGVMTSRGRLPIRTYSDGGVTDTPQLAMFGEGSTPEAYVPVPSGKIPVEIKNFAPATPANNNGSSGGITLNMTFNGITDADSFKRSANQIAARMAGAMQTAMRRG